MHCMLEGHANHHFRTVLNLTSASAADEQLPEKAFLYNFTKIPQDGPFPNNMALKEIKQVDAIHVLLTASLEGVGNDGQVVDQESFTESLASLSRRLLSKNMKALQFVCNDLECLPRPPPLSENSEAMHTRLYKKDWVAALVTWVSFSYLQFVLELTYLIARTKTTPALWKSSTEDHNT